MREFAAGDLTRNTGDLFESAAVAPVAITKHRKPRFVVMSIDCYRDLTQEADPQIAVDVAAMPEDIGLLFDQGVVDHFNDK